MLECPHDMVQLEGHHQPVDQNSLAYQKILEIAAKTQFINDMERLKHGNLTSFVESFHNVCIRYRPKRKFYPRKGFEIRTKLAALAFNANRIAEQEGKRTIREIYEYHSKATGENRQKIKMGPPAEAWKAKIVEDTIERKRLFGSGHPMADEEIENDQDDALLDWFNQAINLESDEDVETEEE